MVFVGNSGSGKTTLAERISLECDLAMNYANLKDLPTPNLESIFYEVIDKQRNIRKHILSTILESEGCFDRSVFDEYCYSNRFLGESMPKRYCMESFLVEALGELKWSRLLLLREVSIVDHYFFCQSLKDYNKENKIEDESPSDKKRWGDLTLEQIYIIMRDKLLPKNKLTIVPADGLEERVCFVKNVIDNKWR